MFHRYRLRRNKSRTVAGYAEHARVIGERKAAQTVCSNFLHAARDGHIDIVKRYIEQNGEGYHWIQRCNAMNVSDGDDNTALILAASKNHTDIISLLLSSQVNINACNRSGETALFAAAANGHADVVKLLLSDPRIIIGSVNNDRQTPLTIAIKNGHVEVVRVILETGTLTNQYDNCVKHCETVNSDNHQEILRLLRMHRERFDFRANIDLNLSAEDIKIIHTMPSLNFERLQNMTNILINEGRCNHADFNSALHKATARISSVTELSVTKAERPIDNIAVESNNGNFLRRI